MARTPKSKVKRGRAKKLSRFPMSRKLEVALGWLGGILVLAAVLFIAGYLAQKYWHRSAEISSAQKAVAAERAALLEKLRSSGVVVSEVRERETLFVDAARWRALSFRDREHASAAGADRFASHRCFILNAADASAVGFYSRSGGYRAREDASKSH